MEDRCKRCRQVATLKQGQRLFQDLLRESRDVLYYYDLTSGRYEYITPSVESLTGYTAEEFVSSGGTLYLDLMDPPDKALYIALEKALRTNQNQSTDINIECRVRHKKDGRYTWMSDHMRVLRRKNGNAKGVLGIVRDITDSKKLQQQLEQSESIFRNLFDHAPVALFRSRTSDGKLLEANEQCRRLLGYNSKAELLNTRTSSHLAHPGHREKLLKRLAEENQIQGLEIELKRADGSTFWADFSVKLLPEQGTAEGVIRDISVIKSLTAVEKQVLILVLEGQTNREIARNLHRSIRTIEDHRAHIMGKLHAHNLIELAQKAQLSTTF